MSSNFEETKKCLSSNFAETRSETYLRMDPSQNLHEY